MATYTSTMQTVYIPDFFVIYIGDDGQEHQMMIEVKPAKEALDEHAIREGDRILLARNKAKWEAAAWWCQRRGIEFRIMTEGQIFGDPSASRTGAFVSRSITGIPVLTRHCRQLAGTERAGW